jgi:hypothetical protein
MSILIVPSLYLSECYEDALLAWQRRGSAQVSQGPSRTILTGIWNERTQTMYWSGKDHLKNTITGKHRFGNSGFYRLDQSTQVAIGE